MQVRWIIDAEVATEEQLQEIHNVLGTIMAYMSDLTSIQYGVLGETNDTNGPPDD